MYVGMWDMENGGMFIDLVFFFSPSSAGNIRPKILLWLLAMKLFGFRFISYAVECLAS